MQIPRLIYISLLIILVSVNLPAQTRSANSLSASDTSDASADKIRHAFYGGAGYGSNMIYLGSTISQNQPYGYGSLTYGFKNQLYASVSAVHLSGTNPYFSFYIGALNYSHTFNSWFDIAAGVYRYQVPSALTDSLFTSFSYGDFAMGFDWKLLYSKVSVGGLLSNEKHAYFQFRNSRYFQTKEFFNGKVNISFDPYINMLFGTLVTVKTKTDTSVSVSTTYHQWRKPWKGNKPNTSPGTTTTTLLKKFGLAEVNFGLPVAINTDFMTVEAEVSYVLPVYKDPAYSGTKGFLFMLTAFFRIF
jgi:hypothetical protein